jgi:hypothetical protein
MPGDALNGVDPRLVERFALFREPGPGPDGPLDHDEVEWVEDLRARALSPGGLPLAKKGLAFDNVRKVVLSPTRDLLAIPGRAGIHISVRSTEQSARYGASTGVDRRLEGKPILSVGPYLIGLAVDDVREQPVEFRDGSIGYAQVANNAYCIEDPSWVAPTPRPRRRF